MQSVWIPFLFIFVLFWGKHVWTSYSSILTWIIIFLLCFIILFNIQQRNLEGFDSSVLNSIIHHYTENTDLSTSLLSESDKINEIQGSDNPLLSSKIPKNLFQTWHTKNLPPKMSECVESLKEQNPEFEYQLFDDDDCRNFIRKHFDESVLDAYYRIIPGAYKADLWRYCVLYIHGGIYLDIKFTTIPPFKLIDLIDKEHYVRDISKSGSGIYNAFMVCRAKNPILHKLIQDIVTNVKNDYYGDTALSPTGPMLMKPYFENSKSVDLFLKTDFFNTFIHNSNGPILKSYQEYRIEQKKYASVNGEYYAFYWNRQNIYKKIKKEPIIPLLIYQTWHTKTLPEKMKRCVNQLKKQNPEFKHYLFDDMDCRDFIATHFDTSVVDAFDRLIPGAYKADLWRYCVLYIHGGIYLDIKYECKNNFKLIDLMDREHFVLERPDHWTPTSYGVYNAVMVCKPKNQILKKCIDRIVENVKNEYYGFNPLYPTGPGLLGDIYFENNDSITGLDLFYKYDDGKMDRVEKDQIVYKKQCILQNYPEYRIEQKTNSPIKHYNQLWQEHKIYVTEENNV